MSAPSDVIYVRGLELFGPHGCSKAERELGVRMSASVSVEVRQDAGRTDAIADTVDYAALAQVAVDTIQGPPRKTLEYLAEEIARRVLERWPQVSRVTVELEKPSAPLPLVIAGTGVRIVRERMPPVDHVPAL
jgi:dihydroneopterin aldolase